MCVAGGRRPSAQALTLLLCTVARPLLAVRGHPSGKEVPMSMSLLRSNEAEPARPLARVRSQAALVQALLDELARIVPPENGCGREDDSARLIEEVARLGCGMLECAAAMTDERARSEMDSAAWFGP